jgi:hypothetical protein
VPGPIPWRNGVAIGAVDTRKQGVISLRFAVEAPCMDRSETHGFLGHMTGRTTAAVGAETLEKRTRRVHGTTDVIGADETDRVPGYDQPGGWLSAEGRAALERSDQHDQGSGRCSHSIGKLSRVHYDCLFAGVGLCSARQFRAYKAIRGSRRIADKSGAAILGEPLSRTTPLLCLWVLAPANGCW